MILAAIFKLFGVYTKLSAAAALTFNALVSALTCTPVALIAYECLGAEQAVFDRMDMGVLSRSTPTPAH